MVYYVGTVLGQLMVSKLPTDLMSVLPWVTALTLAAILPLLFTRVVNQVMNSMSRRGSGQCSGCVRPAMA